MLDIVRGMDRNPTGTKMLVEELLRIDEIDGTLYIGYPLQVQSDNSHTIDALLVSKDKGLVAFILGNPSVDLRDKQDDLYFQLDYTLKKYPQLRKGRELSISPVVYTFYSDESSMPQCTPEYLTVNSKTLKYELDKLEPVENQIYFTLVEALQRISSMKPKKKRTNVKNKTSYGGIIKQIELEIANLDEFQKKAAYEFPNGVQRIRGLAGSGKTVVLALKVAYLHSQNPDWNIAVTFYTRTLSQQFKDMIGNFYREFSDDEYDETKIHILHAWGNNTEKGIYSEACRKVGIAPFSFHEAQRKYGRNKAFEGIVNELVEIMPDDNIVMFDMILIDEAQDMPASFFRLCYNLLDNRKQLVYAYDELQNLSTNQMPTTKEMFGENEDKVEKVSLLNEDGKPKKDIVLPVCYRNTRWALTLAHSLGFGIYREPDNGGMVQFFNDSNLWDAIGYETIDGSFKSGKKVSLRRRNDSSPSYLDHLLSPNDAIKHYPSFESKQQQYKAVAKDIYDNIKNDELDADDILVIFPNTYSAKMEYASFREYLNTYGIESILSGETTNRDIFKVENKVTCSHIHRAKGNEAPMVYILNVDYCSDGDNLIQLRNTLFTAITRSRAWVRISGVGTNMEKIIKEINKCIKENEYTLNFRVPTSSEIETMRSVHRELSEEEQRNKAKLDKLLSDLEELKKRGILDEKAKSQLKDISE